MSSQKRPFIVHVTADHPDAFQPAKTPVIERLVELAAPKFDQKVISLNRVAPSKPSWIWPSFSLNEHAASDAVDTLIYRAPPAGIHHRRTLIKLGEALAERIGRGPAPDLLIGHKLTVEGIAVARAAKLLGVPYALSIQGNTDERILRMRPDLRRYLAPIFHSAKAVFPFTPWALRSVEWRLGKRTGPTVLLPCPMARDTMIPPRAGGENLVTAFHLRNFRLKNLPLMASALQQARRASPKLELAVIGGGAPAEEAAARSVSGEGIRFEGAVPNEQIAARFNAARGFIMPSHRESFGLVFIEALFAGLPIAYPAGASVDGYFDNCPFALRVDAGDENSVADAMAALDRDEARLKQALAEWQASDGAGQFTRDAIGAAFTDGLTKAIAA